MMISGNRPGLNSWNEDTPAFKIIRILANVRKKSLAISQGAYVTAYVHNDILMFERVHCGEIVLVAVKKGHFARNPRNRTGRLSGRAR
jgi:cyclomaltodextrin glucanotransferase